MFSISTQVLIVKLFLSFLIIAVSFITLWYCLVVYYDPHFQVGRPLGCVSSELTQLRPMYQFWLDKLALLAATRAGTTVFWDDAIDLSILSTSTRTPTGADGVNDLENTLRRIGAKCGMELTSSDPQRHVVWTLTTLGKPQLFESSPFSFLLPKLMHLPGAFVFKVHLRLCGQRFSESFDRQFISCPSYFHDDNDDEKRKDDLLLPQDLFPINTEKCVIAGAETHCPNNVENILRQEFGETWKSELLLNFKRRERKI